MSDSLVYSFRKILKDGMFKDEGGFDMNISEMNAIFEATQSLVTGIVKKINIIKKELSGIIKDSDTIVKQSLDSSNPAISHLIRWSLDNPGKSLDIWKCVRCQKIRELKRFIFNSPLGEPLTESGLYTVLVPVCDSCRHIRRCNNCYQRGTSSGLSDGYEMKVRKLLKCGRCKVAYYCDMKCQKSHFSIHKAKCLSDNISISECKGKDKKDECFNCNKKSELFFEQTLPNVGTIRSCKACIVEFCNKYNMYQDMPGEKPLACPTDTS